MRRTFLLPAAAAALSAAVLAGCSEGKSPTASGRSAPVSGGAASAPTAGATETSPSGDIPDTQAYTAYQPAGGGFTVKVPEGWARTTTATAASFTDKLNRIEITSAAAPAAPTFQSVTSQVVPVLKGQVPAFAVGKVSVVSRSAGQAVLLTYQGDTAPDPVTGKVVRDAFERYSFQRNGREVVLTLSGPVQADNVDPWRIVTDSFRWQ
jgi:hypothetical protein